MYGMKAIIGKELVRVFKDKKMIISLFVLPVILVVGLFALMSYMVGSQMDDIEGHTPIVYIQNAPESFSEFLTYNGESSSITYLNSTEETEQIKNQILNGEVDLLIVFPEGFDAAVMADYEAVDLSVPDINTFYNPSEDYSSEARNIFVSGYFEGYKQALLLNRFGSLDSVQMFTIDATNTESVIQDEDKAVGKILGMMLPYFITMLIFATAMGLGVDMIAGEKERGTLASMLLSPVSRTQIVWGKVLALAVLSVLSAAVYIITMVVAMPKIFESMGSGTDLGGLSVNFTATQILQMVFLMMGVVILYVSVICMVAVFAKSTKEASTLITPAYLIVIVAGFMTMYSTGENAMYKYAIPVYGSSMALKDIFTREITAGNFAVSLISTYLVSVVLVFIMTKAFNSEKIMFNA